jgi:cytochrome P450
MIRLVEDDLRARARRLLAAVEPGEPFDFLVDVAAELPMQMICILLGVPESERHWLFEAIEPQFDFGGSRKASVSQMPVEEAGTRMYSYGQELIASKRSEPTDDMLSVVANATVDDGELARPPSGGAVPVLQPALQRGCGNHAQRCRGRAAALADHPDQLAMLREDLSLLPTAVEEMVRWTSPSPSKRRTATRDVELGGCAIEAGQKVQIWEGSANRDPAAFDDPDTFDIVRKPNPHLGFGQGIHYCLGANLARLELRVLFEVLLGRFSSARVVKPVEWTRSNRHTGIRHLIVELEV